MRLRLRRQAGHGLVRAPVAVQLLPEKSRGDTKPHSRYPRKNARGGDDPEEIPQSSREAPRIELHGQQAPCERSGSDEPHQKAEVGGDVLDGGTAQTVELGNYCRAPESVSPVMYSSDPCRGTALALQESIIFRRSP